MTHATTAQVSSSSANNWEPPTKASATELNEIHAEMRARCPIARGADPRTGTAVWTLFRRSDVMAAAQDNETFSNGKRVRLSARRIPLESDPPEHTALRRLLQPFFAPKHLSQFEPVTQQLVDLSVGAFIKAGGGDFARMVARRLPTQVVLARIGQPVDDWVQIKQWSEDTVPRKFKNDADEQLFAQSDRALWNYSRMVVEKRKAQLLDSENDILSAVLTAEIDGNKVDEELVVGCVRLLVAAGHDSTTQALGICVHYLARRPELQERLRKEPTLIRAAIEEILRLESPVVAMPRIATRDTELLGCPIHAGDKLMLNWSSANHDQDGLADAETFRLDRGVNAHLAFGHGIHSCLGAPLARQELRLTLERMLASSRNFHVDGLVEMMNMAHYGFERLPVRVEQ